MNSYLDKFPSSMPTTYRTTVSIVLSKLAISPTSVGISMCTRPGPGKLILEDTLPLPAVGMHTLSPM